MSAKLSEWLLDGLDVNGMRKMHEQFSVDLAIFGYGFLEN